MNNVFLLSRIRIVSASLVSSWFVHVHNFLYDWEKNIKETEHEKPMLLCRKKMKPDTSIGTKDGELEQLDHRLCSKLAK